MLRVGYPATIAAELFAGFPEEVELIALSEHLDHDVEIDVWIPDPYPTRAQRIAPRLRGVRLVLSLMAGTEWIPGAMGPHVTICNAHGAHNIATAEWTLAAILAALKYFPLFSMCSDQACGNGASRPVHTTPPSVEIRGPIIRQSCRKNSPAKMCCWWATVPLGKRLRGFCSRTMSICSASPVAHVPSRWSM